MKYLEESVSIDVNTGYGITTLNMTQNDTNVKVYRILLTDKGMPVELDDTCNAKIYGNKPDGTQIFNECSIEASRVIYKPTTQTISAIGDVECIIKVYSTDESDEAQKITSARFVIEVSEDLMSGEAIESTNEYSALTKSMSECDELISKATDVLDESKELIETTKELNAKQEELNKISEENNKLFEGIATEKFSTIIDDENISAIKTFSSKKLAEMSGDISNLDTENKDNFVAAINEINSVAKGRSTGHVFDTYDDMVEWCSDNSSSLKQGDNLYIRQIDVPDYWWDGETYCQLETQKVDLTSIEENIDNLEERTSSIETSLTQHPYILHKELPLSYFDEGHNFYSTSFNVYSIADFGVDAKDLVPDEDFLFYTRTWVLYIASYERYQGTPIWSAYKGTAIIRNIDGTPTLLNNTTLGVANMISLGSMTSGGNYVALGDVSYCYQGSSTDGLKFTCSIGTDKSDISDLSAWAVGLIIY